MLCIFNREFCKRYTKFENCCTGCSCCFDFAQRIASEVFNGPEFTYFHNSTGILRVTLFSENFSILSVGTWVVYVTFHSFTLTTPSFDRSSTLKGSGDKNLTLFEGQSCTETSTPVRDYSKMRLRLSP